MVFSYFHGIAVNNSGLGFALCILIAVAVPFALTCFVGKKRLSGVAEEMTGTKADEFQMKAFLDGPVIPLKEVGDGVFSEGILGDGFAILPENNVLCAPTDGVVAALMEDSKHACGLKLENGMEILLHIGLDTVSMAGDGFEYLVSQDEAVKTGAPLIHFDREKIKKAGYRDVTICVISNPGNVGEMEFYTGVHAVAGETVVAAEKKK